MFYFDKFRLQPYLFSLSVLIVAVPGFLSCSASGDVSSSLEKLDLPDGFAVEIYAGDLPNARSMAMSTDGILFVGTRRAGKVYAVVDENGDNKANRVYVIAENLNMPNGVALRDGSLYVAEVNRILRFDNISARLDNPPDPVVVNDQYPSDEHHGWKYIAFGPDDKLYIPVGAPCNICNPDNELYATITRINPDGTNREIVAHGVRNSVGFDWHPETGNLWFTDNGRDWLGDNRPPDELNRLTKPGEHFGYPYFHGRDIWDPEFGERGKQLEINFKTPARELGPHVAALGMLFYTGEMFPAEYQGDIFIAEHGSWNRSTKIGYRITRVQLEDGEAVSYEPFVQGWLEDDESVWGRPVDLLQLQDGSLLVSDDYSGTIYRIRYTDQH